MTLKSNAPLPENDDSGLPLREIFNREAAKAVKDFPQLDGRFIFIDAPDNIAIMHIDKEKLGIDDDYQLHRLLSKVKNSAEQMGSSMSTKLGYDQLDVMVFTPLPFKLFTGKDQPQEMEVMATFDHELGHLVVKGGFFSQDSTLREIAADAYAVLRHIQRYGDKSEAIDRGGWRRAFDFIISGDAGHFTTLGIDEVTRLKDKLDIQAMTPQQTAELAGRIALAYTPHADVTNEAARSFEPVRTVLQRTHSIEAALEKLAQITLSEDASYHTFKIGARCLERFLDNKVFKSKDGEPIALNGKFWDEVRTRVSERLAAIDDHGLLHDMPLKGQASAPKNTAPLPPAEHDAETQQPHRSGWHGWRPRRAA
jgi:hypothetical protein